MDPTRNRADYWAAQRRQARLDRDIFPIDHRIKRLRADIRKRLHHLRALKEKGYPLDHSRRLLVLLCRTLGVDSLPAVDVPAVEQLRRARLAAARR